MACSMTWNGKKLRSCTILTIVTVIALFAGVIAFLVIFTRSPKLEVTVTNASMTQFSLNSTKTDNNTLYYNLALDVAIRNPSSTFSIHYNRIEVTAKYKQQSVAMVTLSLPPFNQGTKNITILHPVLQGQSSSFETDEGVYSIDVQFAFRIRRRSVLKGIVYKPQAKCMLKVPSSFNKTSPSSGFKATQLMFSEETLN